MRFIYSLIRIVPDPLRGEFVNVGAIVGSEETGEWDVRRVKNLRRANYVAGGNAALRPLSEFEGDVLSIIAEHEEGGLLATAPSPSAEWLSSLNGEHQGVIQVSMPAFCVVEELDDAFDLLFENFIVEPESQARSGATKSTVRAAVKNAYRMFLDNPNVLHEGLRIETNSQHEASMDFAVMNGELVQLSQAWSLQLDDQELLAQRVKAWAYTVDRLKRDGGNAFLADEQCYPITSDTEIELVYAPPTEDQRKTRTMKDILATVEELPINARVLGDESRTARRAHELLL